MSLLPAVLDYCRTHGYGSVRSAAPLGGGCINNATRLETESGLLFLKVNSNCPPDMFEREADGLAALAGLAGLAAPGGPRVPRVLLFGPDFILQEFIDPAPRPAGYWETLGRQLAALHNVTSPRFGFPHDNYIGSTPQVNTWTESGYDFFAEQRLGCQARLARRNELLDEADYKSVAALAARLDRLVPTQPASLIHGDLWSGNLHSGPNGEPVLIDPAAHYGWAEAELAMMTLFGSPPAGFFQAYESVRPLATGWRERLDLYNIYHLLNHLNLFGGSYAGSVRSILRRYA
jgi:fructosamine-3-kinase